MVRVSIRGRIRVKSKVEGGSVMVNVRVSFG
jgi:hypothetical protein